MLKWKSNGTGVNKYLYFSYPFDIVWLEICRWLFRMLCCLTYEGFFRFFFSEVHFLEICLYFFVQIFPNTFSPTLWSAVRDFITFFVFIRLCYEYKTFFAFIKLSSPKIRLSFNIYSFLLKCITFCYVYNTLFYKKGFKPDSLIMRSKF